MVFIVLKTWNVICLADPGKAMGCCTNSLVINWLILWVSQPFPPTVDQAKPSRGKFTYAPIRPELCSYLLFGTLIKKMQKIRNFVYVHQSPTAPLNTMGITMAKSEKVDNFSFVTKIFIHIGLYFTYRKGLDQSMMFY